MNRVGLSASLAWVSLVLTAHAAAPFAPYDPPAIYDGIQETSEYLRGF